MNAFKRRDLSDFIYALEFMGADVSHEDETGLTIFQDILQTPNSADFIKGCIANGADCYTVSFPLLSCTNDVNARLLFVLILALNFFSF